MVNISDHKDNGCMRIYKQLRIQPGAIDEIVANCWAEKRQAKGRSITASLNGTNYSLPKLQPYVEGPVIQTSLASDSNPAADFMLLMHPMNKPRMQDGGKFEGLVVDSGLHLHCGPRKIQIFVGSGSLITIPVLSQPEVIGMNNREFQLNSTVFEFEDCRRNGFELILAPGQVVEASLDGEVAHSFNGLFEPSIIFSHHPNEAKEIESVPDFAEIGDGSDFLIGPKVLKDFEIENYLKIRDKFLIT